jgi:hypothetical protein
MPDIAAFFDRCGWAYAMPEANLWHSTFFTENEEEFDLYVMVVEDWVHFAVTPFIPPIPAAQTPRLYAALLKLNQQLHSVRFALDGDNDVTLIADAAAQSLDAATFTHTLEAIVFYTDRLATELWRMADEPTYFSPLVQE